MYHNFIFLPLYNGFVGILNLFPWMDIGLAMIIFTIVVKIILFPIAKKSLLTQVKMKEVEPEAQKIREMYKNDKQAQAMKIMQLYKEKKFSPFSSVILLIIQLPILFALIQIFYKVIPTVNADFLYSFLYAPHIKTMFIGLVDLTNKSIILSLLTAIAQYFQLKYSPSMRNVANQNSNSNPQAMAMQSMNSSMKYFLPAFAFISTYWIIPAQFPAAASAIALYWMTSTLFTFVQELYIRKKHIK